MSHRTHLSPPAFAFCRILASALERVEIRESGFIAPQRCPRRLLLLLEMIHDPDLRLAALLGNRAGLVDARRAKLGAGR
jgi:hypothetical protein